MKLLINFRISLAASLALLLHLPACTSSVSQVSNSISLNLPKQQLSENPKQTLPDTDDRQISSLLEKEFNGLFLLSTLDISPNYLKGDFNGDNVEDIIIAVHLNRDLEENDKSKTPFMFYKPYGGSLSIKKNAANEYVFTMGDLARYRGETIVAIVHGVKEKGLNDSNSYQKFVLVDGWDHGEKIMKLYRGILKAEAIGDAGIEPAPKLKGNAVLFLNGQNTGTAIYWDGKRYRWYPVESLPK